MGRPIIGAKAFVHKWDASGELVGATPERTLEVLEYRPFSSKAVKKEAGLFSSMLTLAGVMDVAGVDPAIGPSFFSEVGNRRPASVYYSSTTPAEGSEALFASGLLLHPDAPIVHGNLFEFQQAIEVDGQAFPGVVFGFVAGIGTKTVSGNTAAGIVLPAAVAGQTLCAVLHVTGTPVGTLDVTIESADAGDPTFTSPTTHITFAQVGAAAASEAKTKKFTAPVTTDTLWRAVWAPGGATPSFPMAVALGIHA